MNAPRVALLAGLLGAGPALAQDEALTVEAARVLLADGRATGDGGVRVQLGAVRIEGARFTYAADTGVLTVEAGSWQRDDGLLRFERLDIDLADRAARLHEVDFEAADGSARLRAERLRIDGGPWEAEDLSLTGCSCEEAPWELRARRVTVRPGQDARFRGGWVALCGWPVLPVPAGRVPLQPRASGLLPPHLGLGDDGLRVGLPVYLVLGPSADLTLEPELRTERGLRGLLEGRWALAPGQGGALHLAGGEDRLAGGPRGAAQLEHGWAPGPWWTAADALVLSDLDYLDDYGGDFLSRQSRMAEARAGLGRGPLALSTDLFQAEDPALQQLVAGALHLPGGRLGPVALAGRVQADVVGEGSAPWSAADPRARAGAVLQASTGARLGPTRAEARADAALSAWQEGAVLGAGRLGGAWLVEGWSRAGGHTFLHEGGLGAAVAASAGELPAAPLPGEALPPAWEIGPQAATRLIGPGGLPLSASGRLLLRPDGPWAEGALRLEGARLGAQASLDPAAQWLQTRWDDGLRAASLGAARLGAAEAALLQGSASLAWTLPAPLGAWRPSYRALGDLQAGALLSHGPGLRYTSPCDCLRIGATGSFSADRAWPELGLQVEVY